MSVDLSSGIGTGTPTSRGASPSPATGEPSRRAARPGPGVRRAVEVVWPKLLAVLIVVALWQAIYASGWKPDYRFASPADTVERLWFVMSGNGPFNFWMGVQNTIMRGIQGFALSLVIGTILGIAVSQWRVLRNAIGAMITGLQTMPSIVWFPFAILLFGLDSSAIYFVVLMGAIPSIANGIINGIDDVPPSYLRAGHMLGARGWRRYRFVVIPAALPAYVAGLSQGWAFAWRGLLAGEIIVSIPEVPALGTQLNQAAVNGQSANLLALMIVVLVIGMLASFVFSSIGQRVRARRGLTGFTAGGG
ncbi:ABC transporter permease subunit [Nocardioides sp.]|uniref:ABC transporter permease n=1 Tax=Nocardioides sp. TaxID=35761 RepID=UPI00321B546F